MNPFSQLGNSNSVTKKIKRICFMVLLLAGIAGSQTVNTNILPGTNGLDLGSPNQRWNVWAANVNIVGTCTLNGGTCLGGGGGNVFNGIGFGSSFQDVLFTPRPANPAAGLCRLYVDNTTFQFSGITSSGSSCMPSGGGGGSGTVTNVATGTGLTGGPISVSGTLSLLASYQLPQTCGIGQVPTWNGTVWNGCATTSSGTVTGASIGFGLISVSGSTTLNFSLAGTSGGIPYFSSASTWASSNLLATNAVVIGGGAGLAPSTIAADSVAGHALFTTAGAPAFRAVLSSDIPTLNQNTSGTASNVTGTVLVAHGGTGNTTTALYNVPVGTGATSYDTASLVPDCNGSSNALNFTRANVGSTTPWTCLSISTLTNPMTTVGDILYGGIAGAVTRLAGPTTPATPFVLTSTPSGGLATAPFWNITGLGGRNVSGTSDTILGSDRTTVVTYTSSSAIGITLPQAGTGGGTSSDFTKNFVVGIVCATGVCTVTPTTSTINGIATMTVQNQSCRIQSQDNANYLAVCAPNLEVQNVPTDTGAANAYVAAEPNMQNLIVGSKCVFQVAHANTAASTLNCSGTGIKSITKNGTAALVNGDMTANSIAYTVYDGTEWQLLDPASGTGTVTSSSSSNGQYAQFTTATNIQGVTAAAAGGATGTLTTFPIVDGHTGDLDAEFKTACDAIAGNNGGVNSGGGVIYAVWNGAKSGSTGPANGPLADCAYTNIYMMGGSSQEWDTDTTIILPRSTRIFGQGRGSTTIAPTTALNNAMSSRAWSITSTNLVRASNGTVTATGTFTASGGAITSPEVVEIGCTAVADLSFVGEYETTSITGGGSPTAFTYKQPQLTTQTSTGTCYAIAGTPIVDLGPQAIGNGATFGSGVSGVTFDCKDSVGSTNPTGFSTGCIGVRNIWSQERSYVKDSSVVDFNFGCFVLDNQTTSGLQDSGPYENNECYQNPGAFNPIGDAANPMGVPGAYPAFGFYVNGLTTRGIDNNTITTTNAQNMPVDATTIAIGNNGASGCTTVSCSISDPGTGGSGTGATCTTTVGGGVVTAVNLTNPGHNYRGSNSGTQNGSITITLGQNACSQQPTATGAIPAGLICIDYTSTGTGRLFTDHCENYNNDFVDGTQGASTGGVLVANLGGPPTSPRIVNGTLERISANYATTSDVNFIGSKQNLGNTNTIVNELTGITLTDPIIASYSFDKNGTAVSESGAFTSVPNRLDGGLDLGNTTTGNLGSECTTADASYTVGDLACITATNTCGNCGSTAANQAFIGILGTKRNNLPFIEKDGTASVNSNAGAVWTAGDYICTDASNAHKSSDNGSTPCPNPQRQVGIVKTTSGSVTAHNVVLTTSSAQGSAGGSGTVNSGTASHLAYYASSTTAVSDMGADLTFAVHSLTAGASLIFDLSAATGATAFKIPVQAGCTAGADGNLCYDSTAKLTHERTNGADSISLASTSTSTTTTQAYFATATAGISNPRAIANADLPTIALDKSSAGLINPTADATFTYPISSTSGLTLAGTAPASVSTSTGTTATTLFQVNGVAGGASSNATGTGGPGSAPTIASGTGGAGTGTNAVGGAGGNIAITAAGGGASNGTGINSNGGNVNITPGAAGTGGSGTAGKAGVVQIFGPGAGFDAYQQGSSNTTSNTQIPANSIIIQAPASVTAYTRTLAGAAATGFPLFTNSSGTMTETIAATSGTINAGPALFGGASYALNSVIASTVANVAGHFTNIESVTTLGGSCTTHPQFNVFDGTSNTGTAVTASASTQTKGTSVDQAQTLTFAAGDIIGIYISTAGGTCTTDLFTISAQYSIP